mmetsp:Transcript_113356/g.315573  ORF Transcript_113356/g.315573 Transcript_113356/m.315573 type:complete len:285 (+) Transcript_113356:76-930(+)
MFDKQAGRPIAELQQEFAEAMKELRRRLGGEMPFEDDQMLLRFLLQAYGSVDEAEAAALRGRQDRQTYAAVLEKARQNEALPQEMIIRDHLCFGRWQYPHTTGTVAAGWPPLLVTRSGRSNPQACMEAVTEEQMVEYLLWVRTRVFLEAHGATEKTGKLLLMASVNDLADCPLLSSREPRFFSAVGKVSKLGEAISPFLGRKHIMVNSGMIVTALMAIAKLFVPQKVLDKVATMSCEELPDALGVPKESLPSFLGGSCQVPRDSPLYAEEEAPLDVLEVAGAAY